MSDVLALCDQALDLTFRQRLAIKQGNWQDLHALLDLRGRILAQVMATLSDLPAEREVVHERLAQIREHDSTNLRILTARRDEIGSKIGVVRRAHSALAGYRCSMRGTASAAATFDRQR